MTPRIFSSGRRRWRRAECDCTRQRNPRGSSAGGRGL